jgi:hypothetical protein
MWVANYNFRPDNGRLRRLASELIPVNRDGRQTVAGYSSYR